MKVYYRMLCNNDVYLEIGMEKLLNNEKVMKVIKSEFAKGLRNIVVNSACEKALTVTSHKEIYAFEAQKKDFADLVELAEEDARLHKRIKKGCSGVEIIDFQTID